MSRPTRPFLQNLALSIRGQVLGSILAVTLPLVAVALNDLHQAWTRYSAARRVETINAYINGLITVDKHYALERGRTNVLLRSTEAPHEDDLAFIAEHRAAGDEALRNVLAGLTDLGDDDISPRVVEIVALKGRIEDLRLRADGEIARPSNERNASLSEFWLPAATRLIERIGDLILVLSKDVRGGAISTLSDIKVAGFLLRLSAGTETTLIGSAIAANHFMDGPQLADAAQLSGRVAGDWERVERLSALINDSRIDSAVKRSRELYSGEFNRMQEVALASAGGGYPFSRFAFSAASVQALNSIVGIIEAAEAASVDQARFDLDAAQAAFIEYALWLAAGIFVAGVTGWLALRHVVGPVEAATVTMRRFAAGDMAASIEGLNLRNEIGDMARALSEFRRITATHAQALSSRNRMLELAEEMSNLGHWRVDAATRHLAWSRGVFLILGRSSETFTPTLDGAIASFHPEDRPVAEKAIRDALANGGSFNLDLRIIRPEGMVRNVEVVARSETDTNGTVLSLFGAIRDITRRKKSEEELRRLNARLKGDVIERTGALRESQARMRAIFEAEPQCLQLIAHDGVVMEINPAGLAMWEAADTADIVGRPVFPLVVPTQRSAFRALHRRVLNGETGTQEFEIEGLKGGHRSVIVTGVPLRDWIDGIVAALYVAQDVSERRAMEAQLRQAQKMEAVGHLTGGIAHDFNNLLGVIVGNLDLLRLDMEARPVKRQLKLIDRTLDAAERGSSLTHRLLAFSRRQTLRPQLVDVNRLMTGMSSMLRRTLGGTVDVIAKETRELWQAHVDPGHLESAVLNLAINARDAMPEGGRLTLTMENVVVDAEFADVNPDIEPGDYIKIRVADNGIGMTPETLERCFDPFFTTKEVGKGSGLGLSMVYGFVKQSGGYVHIESVVGRGTMVDIYLPRAAEEQIDRTQENSSGLVPRGVGQTVLVVEDNIDMRLLSVTALKDLGYRPLEAADGWEALQRLASDPSVKLLFSDVLLPGGMTGFDLARQASQRRPDLKVLFTSGFTEKAVLPDDVTERGWQLVPKPYRWVELGRTIAAVLKESTQ